MGQAFRIAADEASASPAKHNANFLIKSDIDGLITY